MTDFMCFLKYFLFSKDNKRLLERFARKSVVHTALADILFKNLMQSYIIIVKFKTGMDYSTVTNKYVDKRDTSLLTNCANENVDECFQISQKSSAKRKLNLEYSEYVSQSFYHVRRFKAPKSRESLSPGFVDAQPPSSFLPVFCKDHLNDSTA
ncbi:hypothetical protein HELRODRAFT_160098 [Helobdella robusta]|uniref:Uncharacterized protein n=1 Tax=Helobdella robusta TaxID=6412 RepID=T1EPS3_HELRO|nr:hypothetical protein HELRODRAFT_160098 [Helobdella robusta]ESO05993.1 hypothetical protein HELRODRAFT_160098 [Helobdella robusta]